MVKTGSSTNGRVERFIHAVQAYYGKYASPLIISMVADWLRRHDNLNLETFFDILTRTFSSQYGKQPDVAILEKTLKEGRAELDYAAGNYETEDGRVFRNNIFIGHFDGARFLPNLSIIQGSQRIIDYKGSYKGIRTPEDYERYLSTSGTKQIEAPDA